MEKKSLSSSKWVTHRCADTVAGLQGSLEAPFHLTGSVAHNGREEILGAKREGTH